MADGELLRELNRDVWHAFVRAYGARDVTAFLAVHSPDLIRAGGPEKHVHGHAEYAAQTEQWFADLTERGDDIGIDSNEAGTVTEETFGSGADIDDVAAFTN